MAAEGVEAVKLEANLYAAVVGPPGLATLQYVLDRISPLSLSTELEAALADRQDIKTQLSMLQAQIHGLQAEVQSLAAAAAGGGGGPPGELMMPPPGNDAIV